MFGLKFEKKRKTKAAKRVACLEANGIDLVVDVGANLGQTRDSLRTHGYTGHILSIEPLSAAHDVLLEKSKRDGKWTIAPRMGLGARDEVMRINVSQASDLSSFLKPAESLLQALPKAAVVGSESVQVKTLDIVLEEYCAGYRNIFVKVDTQGFEGPVLEGARESLGKIKGIELELSLISLYEGEKIYVDYLNYLHAHGFEIHMLTEMTFSRKLKRQLQIDVVAFR